MVSLSLVHPLTVLSNFGTRIQEKKFQNDHGRRETYNRKYQCVPVQDAEMAATLRAAHGNVGSNGYRSGGRIVIELN